MQKPISAKNVEAGCNIKPWLQVSCYQILRLGFISPEFSILGSRLWFLDPGSWISGSDFWVLGFTSQVLDFASISNYYKVWQKVVTKGWREVLKKVWEAKWDLINFLRSAFRGYCWKTSKYIKGCSTILPIRMPFFWD